MKTKTVATLLAVLLLLLTAVVAIAAPDPVVARHVVSGGGGRISGATMVLYSVIGEPVATSFSVTGSYGHAAGFLFHLSSSGEQLFLPMVQKK